MVDCCSVQVGSAGSGVACLCCFISVEARRPVCLRAGRPHWGGRRRSWRLHCCSLALLFHPHMVCEQPVAAQGIDAPVGLADRPDASTRQRCSRSELHLVLHKRARADTPTRLSKAGGGSDDSAHRRVFRSSVVRSTSCGKNSSSIVTFIAKEQLNSWLPQER